MIRNNVALYGCIFDHGVLQEGIETLSVVYQGYIIQKKINFSFVPNTVCNSLGEKFFEPINEDDCNYAVLKIIVGPEKSCDENCDEDILELVQKIHGKLEDSPLEVMPFIKSCTRNADFYQTKFIIRYRYGGSVSLKMA